MCPWGLWWAQGLSYFWEDIVLHPLGLTFEPWPRICAHFWAWAKYLHFFCLGQKVGTMANAHWSPTGTAPWPPLYIPYWSFMGQEVWASLMGQ